MFYILKSHYPLSINVRALNLKMKSNKIMDEVTSCHLETRNLGIWYQFYCLCPLLVRKILILLQCKRIIREIAILFNFDC